MNPYLYLLNGSPNFNSTAGTSTFFNLTVTGTALFANGTAAAPSIAFSADQTTGIYRIGASNIGVAAGGSKVLDIATTGLGVSGTVSAFNGAFKSSGDRLDILPQAAGNGTIVGAFNNGATNYTPLTVDASSFLFRLSGSGSSNVSFVNNGTVLIGTTTNSSNGILQLATHTTSAGGIGFGTDVSLYRNAANQISFIGGGAAPIGFALSSGNPYIFGGVGGSFIRFNSSGQLDLVTATATSLTLQTNYTTALTLDSSQNATFAGIVIHKSYTVATLPAAAAGNTYGIVFVSDATQLAGVGIGTAPTGGGAIKRGVYSTGAAWLLL